MQPRPAGLDWPSPGLHRDLRAVLAPIGEYKVKMKVGDRELSQPLTLIKDPGAGGSEADVRAQGDLVRDLLDDVKQSVEAINKAERARGQLAAFPGPARRQGAKGGQGGGRGAGQEAPRRRGGPLPSAGHRPRPGPPALADEGDRAARLSAERVAESDYAPTAAQIEVHKLLRDEAARARKALEDVLTTDLARFNAMLAEKQLAGGVANP